MQRIVMGVSGSENAGRTLAWALREAAVPEHLTLVREGTVLIVSD